jgi:hypothetical protein
VNAVLALMPKSLQPPNWIKPQLTRGVDDADSDEAGHRFRTKAATDSD